MPSVDVKLSTTCEVAAAAAAQSSAWMTRGHIVEPQIGARASSVLASAFLQTFLQRVTFEGSFLSGVSPPGSGCENHVSVAVFFAWRGRVR